MDQETFVESYQRWYRPMYLYAYALAKGHSSAEDLVQSAFVKALLSYNGDQGHLRAWLMRVLRNEFLSQRRKDKRLTDDAALETAVDPRGGPLEQLLQSEEQRRVYEAVLALPEPYREVLLQGVVMGLNDGEIATIAGTSEESVRKRRSRAREKLRELLKEDAP